MSTFCLSDVYNYILRYCCLIRPLSKVKTGRDSSVHIALNYFQCIAYVFEYNAVKMTLNCDKTY